MNTPTFLTIAYKGYYILTASDRSDVQIAAGGYGPFSAARTVVGAKRKITNMLKRTAAQEADAALEV